MVEEWLWSILLYKYSKLQGEKMTAIAIIQKNNMDTTSRKGGIVVEKYISGNSGMEAELTFNNLFKQHFNNDNLKYKVVNITDEEYNIIERGWVLDRKDNKIKTREAILADSN